MSSIITSGPAFGQNTIVGITSGLDTGQIVNSILQFERFPAILLEARQSETTNKIKTYKALEAKLLALSASLTSLRRGDIFDNVSTQVSDEEVLSVTSSGGATIGQFDFRVLQLARNHQLASQGIDDPTASGMGTGTIQISVGDASAILGLSIGTRVSGSDVAGTINGEKATGVGQILTGDDGNSTTDGLRLRVTLDSNGIVSGSEATVSFTRGVAARLKQSLDSITNSTNGIISRRVKALTDQVADFRDQIARIDARLEFRRFTLEEEFRKMEEAMTQLNAQNQFLINGLNALRIL